MKKLICVLISSMLILTCGCSNTNNDNIFTSSISGKDTTSVTTSATSSEDKASSEGSQSEEASDTSTSSAPQSSSKNQNSTSSKKNNTSSKKNNTSSKKTNTSSNKTNTSSNDIGTKYYQFEISGTVVDWVTKDDIVYVISKKPNRYISIESETGKVLRDISLPGIAAEMHIFGDELWISYPDLMVIKIYDFQTFSYKRQIEVEHTVSSFDVYNEYIIYSEYDQHVSIYRYNMNTKEEQVCFNSKYFYYADVLIDSNNKKLYIGDSHGTGGKVYCYDVETLERLGVFNKDDYGYSNIQRRMFLLGDGLYWGEFKLDPNNLSRVICQYTANDNCVGMLHVDENFVITNRGFYIRETREQFLEGDFQAATITECGNIMVVEDKTLYIFTDQPA